MNRRLLSYDEASTYLGVSKRWLQDLVSGPARSSTSGWRARSSSPRLRWMR